MKKIILIIFASLMFANIGFAEMRLIEGQSVKNYGYKFQVATFCIDGYKFVAVSDEGRGMVQAFEERDGKSLPAKC